MHITYEALIQKMEQEIAKAKHENDHEKVRGHLFAVKALAELLLETGDGTEKNRPKTIKANDGSEVKLAKAVSQPEQIIVNDETGDSIFDF